MLNICLGCLLVLFSFNINGFDILPDFIGFILIYNGTCKLESNSEYFYKVKILAIVMSIYKFCDFFGLLSVIDNLSNFSSNTPGVFSIDISLLLLIILRIISTFITLYILYLIIKGIEDIEKNTTTILYSKKLMDIWKVISILIILNNFKSYIEINILVILYIISIIITNILFIIYLNSARVEYNKLNH